MTTWTTTAMIKMLEANHKSLIGGSTRTHTPYGEAIQHIKELIDERPDLSKLPDHARLQVEAIIKQYGGD